MFRSETYPTRKVPPIGFGARLTAVVDTVLAWRERSRQRRDLMALSDHQLHDIGLSRADAEREWTKPFWRG